MTSTEALFDEADANRDGYLTEGEFRNFLSRNSTVGLGNTSGNELNNLGVGAGYGRSSYRASAYESSATGGGGGALTGDVIYSGTGVGGAGYGASSYESSYRSSVANAGGDVRNINVTGADAAATNYSATQSTTVQHYETDAQGNFKDANPQIIKRPAQGGPLTYTQNIKVRFLQPPAVPPPGPLIIKEVRPPQPPAPAPLRVRQQAPPLPTPPPLVLRERPPPKPASVASQTVVRNLAAIPVPPRSVIIERIPPAPPKPRDIVIERWIPYGAQAKRKTIVQRADAAKAYAQPRNIIIEYEVAQVRVMRQFQRLGVVQEDPQAYIARYGATLFDTSTLLQQARAAGVVEDISPPAMPNTVTTSAAEFSSSSSTSGTGFERSGVSGIDVGAVGGGAGRSSFYESSSYSSSGDVSGLGGNLGDIGAASYESSSYSSSIGGSPGGIDSNAMFAAADTNNDGTLSLSEFRNAGF